MKWSFRVYKFSGILFFVLVAFAASAQNASKSKEAYTKGMQHFKNARYTEAVKSFDEAIRQDSTNYNAWIRKGFCLGLAGDFEGEMRTYTEVIRHNPEHKWAYISRGSAFNRTGNFDAALEDFNKALELDPSDAEIYNNRGFSYKGKGEKESACKDWHKSKQLGNN